MYRPPAPASVTVGRVLVIVESGLWLLLGLILGVAGLGLMLAATSLTLPGFPGFAVSGSAIGGTVLAAAIVVIGLAVAGIWAGVALGRLRGGARVTALVVASLGVIAALLMLSSGLQPGQTITRPNGTAITVSTTPSLVLGSLNVLLNAAIIWCIGIAPTTRDAFRGTGPGLLPMAVPHPGAAFPAWEWPPPPPSVPGWGSPPPPPDAGAAGVGPPPPPA